MLYIPGTTESNLIHPPYVHKSTGNNHSETEHPCVLLLYTCIPEAFSSNLGQDIDSTGK